VLSPRMAADPSLEYFVLDVFSARRLEGNPLAVVMNPGHLTTEQMQAIARETNLSETVFVERRPIDIEHREGVRARIFTTQEELPFAGHPTLGTASLLRTLAADCVIDDSVTLALNVGPIKVRFEPHAERTWPVYGEMTQRDPEFGAILDTAEVAALTRLPLNAFDPAQPVQIVSTGTAFAIVPLRSAHALSYVNVLQAEARAYLRARGARWFYILGPSSGAPGNRPTGTPHATPEPMQWKARMQFEGGEDPATGSAAGCAVSYLVRHGIVAPGTIVHLSQGIEIHRPSDLFLRADLVTDPMRSAGERNVTNVRVGGSTVLVATGRLFLP
jgi:trans-2,3-dihydro-3-hydroxyanthranilate isomerase